MSGMDITELGSSSLGVLTFLRHELRLGSGVSPRLASPCLVIVDYSVMMMCGLLRTQQCRTVNLYGL